MLENTISTKKTQKQKKLLQIQWGTEGRGTDRGETLEGLQEWLEVGNQRNDCPSDLGNTCILQKTLRSLMANSQKKKIRKANIYLKKTDQDNLCVYLQNQNKT